MSIPKLLSSPAKLAAAPLNPACSVQSVGDGHVCLKNKDGSTERVEFGTCVWATGIATHPLVNLVRSGLYFGQYIGLFASRLFSWCMDQSMD